MMFLPKFFREPQHVDALVVLHACQRLRAKPFLGEKIEAHAAHPMVHQRVRARMPSKTRLQAFFENLVELELQSVYVPDTRRAERHPLGLFLPELEEIEIESTVRNLFGARQPFFRNGEPRKPRWQR